MSSNIDDDDAPPDLVDVATLPETEKPSVSKCVEEPEQMGRVPITIVTGMEWEWIHRFDSTI